MKKLAVITVLVTMLCSLDGCGGKQADSGKQAADGKEAASVETTESTESAVTEAQDNSIHVSVNVVGTGNMNYVKGEETPDTKTEQPYQSSQINPEEPTTYTFVAWPDPGYMFVKWTKNGEDYSTDPQITVLLDESADFEAIFEEDQDWQNPVMNFIGEYQCDRAHATIECMGKDEAIITIEWAGSVSDYAHWDIYGHLDTETMTIAYDGCTKSHIVYNKDGEIESEEQEYDDGTGTITFNDDGTFTWHEDQSETGTDMVFEWLDVTGE